MTKVLFSYKRLCALLACDILFQLRYGFYWLYTFFVIFYAALLSVFPARIQNDAAALLVFTDPAAMGLFFMGAIVLFEKSQRVTESISVSPVRFLEYIASKALSIAIISLISALVIAISVYMSGNYFFKESLHLMLFTLSVVLASIMFTLIALGCASRSKTLNQFMIFTIPFEVVLMLPPVLYIFNLSPQVLEFHPGIIALRMILHEYYFSPLISIVLLLGFIGCAFLFAFSSVKKMMLSWGGIKL